MYWINKPQSSDCPTARPSVHPSDHLSVRPTVRPLVQPPARSFENYICKLPINRFNGRVCYYIIHSYSANPPDARKIYESTAPAMPLTTGWKFCSTSPVYFNFINKPLKKFKRWWGRPWRHDFSPDRALGPTRVKMLPCPPWSGLVQSRSWPRVDNGAIWNFNPGRALGPILVEILLAPSVI